MQSYPKFENLIKGFLLKDMFLFFVSMLCNGLRETVGCTVAG